MLVRATLIAAFACLALPALAQETPTKPNTDWPGYQTGDYVIKDYKFVSGETLSELKLHYRVIGTPKKNASGEIVNGVLLLQGNTGTSANWLRPSLADELYGPGQPFDATQYFVIMPDALGRGEAPQRVKLGVAIAPPRVARRLRRAVARWPGRPASPRRPRCPCARRDRARPSAAPWRTTAPRRPAR